MLQLRPGQCATGHDGGVGGQPRRIAASDPIAAPHRCQLPYKLCTIAACLSQGMLQSQACICGTIV